MHRIEQQEHWNNYLYRSNNQVATLGSRMYIVYFDKIQMKSVEWKVQWALFPPLSPKKKIHDITTHELIKQRANNLAKVPPKTYIQDT